MERESCIKLKSGNCFGCPILDIAVEAAMQPTPINVARSRARQDSIAQGVGEENCPSGVQIEIPETIRTRKDGLIPIFLRDTLKK